VLRLFFAFNFSVVFPPHLLSFADVSYGVVNKLPHIIDDKKDHAARLAAIAAQRHSSSLIKQENT